METLPAVRESPPPPAAPPARRTPWFAAILALGILCLIPGLWMGLHADDWFQVRPRSAAEVLATFSGNWGMGERGQGGFYRPLVRVSFALDNWIHGGSAPGCHLTNGILFVALLAGVYRAGVLLSAGNGRIAFVAAAALLALNPVKNEALYWVSGRTDLLAALAIVWSVHAMLAALAAADGRLWGLWALCCLAMGLGAKEIALAGCAILPIGTLLLAGPGTRRPVRLALVAGPVVLGLAYFAFRAAMLGGLGGYDTPPRSVYTFLESIMTNLSALFWPWQADGPMDYRNALAMPGLVLVGALLFQTGLRGFAFAFAALLLSLIPISFIDIVPDDGGRVLLLPLCFQALLLPALARRGAWWWDLPATLLAAFVALTLQPDNWKIVRAFQLAAAENQQVIDDAWALLESTPENGVFISPEPPRSARRRLLDPGAALQMALLTRWLRQPGAESADVTDITVPRFALELRNGNRHLLLSHALQPWMESGVLSATFTSRHTFKVRNLERIATGDLTLETGQSELPLAVEADQVLVVGVLAAGRVEAAPQLLFTTTVGQMQTIDGWYFQEAGPAAAWMDTLEAGILLPSVARFRPFGSGNPFPLRKLTFARYRVAGNETMGK